MITYILPYFEKGNISHRNWISNCLQNYEKLLGDIKKYNLVGFEDWGDVYITSIDNGGIRIHHRDDDENIMLFTFIKHIFREDKLFDVFSSDIQTIENKVFGNKYSIIINDLKPQELKDLLFKIYGY